MHVPVLRLPEYFKYLNQVIAIQLEEKQLRNALSSDYFLLLIDDIAVINEMVIYARYMHNGSVATMFLKICEL